MNRIIRTAAAFLAVIGLSLAVIGTASATRAHSSPPYYLALGDSVAVGYQTSDIPTDRACTDKANDKTGNRGYACLFWSQLKRAYPGIQFANLGLAVSPGEDSCSFGAIANCLGQKSRVDASSNDVVPYDFNAVSQLSAAEQFIQTHKVAVITLTLGGNDFLPVLHVAETQGPAAAEAMLPGVTTRLKQNLVQIVGTLRYIAPSARLIITDQYNPLSGLPPAALGPHGTAILKLATKALQAFQKGIAKLAKATGSIHADTYDPFLNKAVFLTWITSNQNIHPNGDGYVVIDKAVWAALEDATAALHINVRLLKLVQPGGVQTFSVRTLPYARVRTTLRYQLDGWKTVATMTGKADIDGNLSQKWRAPLGLGDATSTHVRQAKSGTKVQSQSCASYSGKKSKCKSNDFIIASK